MIFDFYIGGFFSESFQLRLKGEDLLCYQYYHFFDKENPTKKVQVKDNALWNELIDYLSRCKWKGRYEAGILDGRQWTLKVVSDTVKLNLYGSNAYPPDFNKILSLLNDISGLDMEI